MTFKTLLAVICLSCSITTGYAQDKIDRSKFGHVDKYVSELGPMEGHWLKYIVDTLTHNRTGPQADQVRALYMWEVQNIDYDTKAHRHPKQANNSPSVVLANRAGSHEGYANLFKSMCDLARIPCAIVTGYAKFDQRNIGDISEKWNRHTWNAVQIDSTWYLLDIPWSAGTTDRKFRFYERKFDDAWFLTNRELFALSHYPDKKQWQLLDTPINKSNFIHAPIIGSAAIRNEVYTEAIRGSVRGRADTTEQMEFTIGNPDLIKSVTVARRMTSQRVPAKYTIEGNKMYVEIPFATEGEYPFHIFINDDFAYTYNAKVSKARRKPQARQSSTKKRKSSRR